MSEYAAQTIKDLKAEAKDRGVKHFSTMDKSTLVKELEKLDAAGDSANFADMPDEVTPAPDPSAETEPAPEPAPAPEPKAERERTVDSAKGPAPVPQSFKLMNDCRFMKPDGTAAILKAGRTLKSNEYDLDRVKASGGVLTPLVD